MSNAGRRQNPNPSLDATAVLAWYDRHARTLPWRVSPADRLAGQHADPYRVWLSEIMLQQTTIAAVRKYYARFTARWPTVADLAAAPLDDVLVAWAGLGYYARARNLHACARTVYDRFGGAFPRDLEGLLQLPGVGPYTGAAIAAITGDQRVAVVDGNVERLLARYLALEVPMRRAKPLIRDVVQAAVPARAGDFAQALMDLGATVCAPRVALCAACPLHPRCAGSVQPLRYPKKAEKPVRPERYGHAFIMRDGHGDIYLQRRAATGLLARMTETPVSPWTDAPAAPAYPVVAEWRPHGQVVHTFTHFRLQLEIWSATVTDTDTAALAAGWWTEPQRLPAEALPSLFRKVLAAAGLP